MMKRVCNTRFAMSAMLLAVFLLVTGAGAPVWARENISAGQAGDPTDGEGISSTGSATPEGDTYSSAVESTAPHSAVPVLVLVVNGLVFHLNIQLLLSRWKTK